MPAPDFVAPRTPLEQALERVWAELLGMERVGIRDDFFELGGNSLIAADLFARLELAHGKRLPLSSLFPDSTIERQAELLAQANPVNHGSVVPIQPHGRGAPFICVHAIDGDVLRFESLARLLGSDQPFFGLRARGLDPDSEPIADVEAMAACYVDDLLPAGFAEPFYLGGFSSGAAVAFEMARQLTERGHAVALLALFDGPAPFRPRRLAERLWRSVQNLPADLQAYAADALRPPTRGPDVPESARIASLDQATGRWAGHDGRLIGAPPGRRASTNRGLAALHATNLLRASGPVSRARATALEVP